MTEWILLLKMLRGVMRRGVGEARRWMATRENSLTVRAGMERYGKRPALILDENKALSYGELLEGTGRYVAALHGKYGVQKGDRVLARTSKSVDALCLYLACTRLGAIYVPVNPGYTNKETAHYVQDAEPRVFVTCDEAADAAFRGRVASVVEERTLARETRCLRPEMGVENVEEDDVAVVCYTSGTTGLPKGAMLTHGGLANNAESLVREWRFTGDDRLLHSLPFYHVHGLFLSLNCSLFTGSSVIWRKKFSAEDVLRWLPHATVMMGVPTFYSRLLSSGVTGDATRNVRLFVSGSAPLSLDLWNKWRQHTGHAILERYGMTEAMVISSCLYEESGRMAGTVGMALPGSEVRINDKGVVEVKSGSLFKGYWRNEKKTKEEFTDDGFFITGDNGEIDEQGFLRILGRAKDLVICGGLNVYPKEIEDIVDQMPEVAESAIIGVPHADFGEAVVAVVSRVAGEKGGEEELEKTIIARLREVVSNYKVPKRVVFVDQLPRNSMAKVQKNLLREQHAKLLA